MIRKFQSGGPSVFVLYTPFSAAALRTSVGSESGATTSSKSSSDDEKGKLTELNLLNMIKEIDGLPSDMQGVIQNVSRLMKMSNFSGSTSDLKTIYLKALQQVKNASFYKDQFDKAYKNVVDNKGINEYAIDDRGRLIAYDKDGKLSQVTIDTYKEHPEKYQLLTNENLLNLRAHDQSYARNQAILGVIENGIGMEKVNDLIKSATSSIGSTTISTEGFVKKENEDISAGIEYLQANNVGEALKSGISIDGLYKAGVTDKNSNKQILQALSYVYNILPENAKTLLKLKSDGTAEGALSFIALQLSSKVSEEHKFDLSPAKGGGSDGAGGELGDGGAKNNPELSPVMALVTGQGSSELINFSLGSSIKISTLGTHTSAIDSNGNIIGEGHSLQEVFNGAFQPVLDISQASFGGKRIAPGLSNRIIIKNGDIVAMDLPIDKEASQNGVIKPDFGLTKRMEQAEDEIRLRLLTDEAEINKVYEKYNLPPKTLGGKFNSAGYARFAAILALADETVGGSAFEFDETVEPVEDDVIRENYAMSVNNAIGNNNNTKDNKKYKLSNGLFGIGKDLLYEGTVFVPIRSNSIINATFGNKNYYKIHGDSNPIHVLAAEQRNSLMLSNPKLLTYLKAPSLSSLQ